MSERASHSSEATRQYGRGAALLSVGIGVTGLVTYLFFALASHTLPEQEYGGITLLWASVFITVSILYRPVEQLLSRTIAERQALGKIGWAPLRVAGMIQLGLGAVFIVPALALRSLLQDDLFSGNETLYWVMVVSVLAYAVSYFARGFLAGQRRFGLYGALVLMESCSRVLFALVVALGILSGSSVVALGIAAAPIASLFVVPLALGRKARSVVEAKGSSPQQDGPEQVEEQSEIDERSERGSNHDAGEFTLSHGSGFAIAVLVIMFSEQTFLNAGPLIVKATEGANGDALAGFVFNLLLVARAPLQLFQAIATSLLPHLTNMRITQGQDTFRHSVKITVLAVVGFASTVVVVLLVAGPELMRLFFGPNFDYDRINLAIVGAGMGIYLTAATLNQAALAQGQARRAAYCWIGSAVFFVAWLALSGIDDVGFRVVLGFTLSAILLSGLLYLLYRNPHERAEDVPTPGSPEEVEARLAAADEGS